MNAQKIFERLGIRDGIFVDVGANDGVTNNMTNELEVNNWKGLLIEPNPVLISKLKVNRKSTIIPKALSSKQGMVKFFIVDGPGNLHGLSRITINKEFENHVEKHSGKISSYEIECTTLNEILRNANMANIDFLKIDVEGHELEVLKGLDFTKCRPRVIVAEDNTKDEDTRVRNYLKSFNYHLVVRHSMNNYFVQKEDIPYFWKERIVADVTLYRWKLKRKIFKIFGKQYKSNYI